jgi:uncharacterized protein
MLSFDTRALESKAVQVDGDLAATDPVWLDADVRPSDAVHVEGRLSAAGEGRFYFSGHLSGELSLDCRRCLTAVPTAVEENVHFLLAPAGDPTTEDDPDVFLFDENAARVDLRPAIRESWLLAVPAFVQCREDCKGLCPHCGTDLNAGTCECGSATDARWDALQQARDQFHS